MEHEGHIPIDLSVADPTATVAYRLGKPRLVHREAHYLSVPVTCRHGTAALVTGAALRHARAWLRCRDVDPRTPELLDEGLARIVDLEWPLPFRSANPQSAEFNRLAVGWRYRVEFAAGEMLVAAVRWNRWGGGRLPALADLR
jgi:hypothetical protein